MRKETDTVRREDELLAAHDRGEHDFNEGRFAAEGCPVCIDVGALNDELANAQGDDPDEWANASTEDEA